MLAVGLLCSGPALASGSPVIGDWVTEEGGIISVFTCGGAICGKVAGVTDFGPDGLNHAGVGGVSTCDQVIIKDMKPNEDGLLNGTITDPTNGKVYTANMRVDDEGALRLRGYVGVPWLGQTRVWKPVKVAIGTNCHFTKK